jgi:hypothetical protein
MPNLMIHKIHVSVSRPAKTAVSRGELLARDESAFDPLVTLRFVALATIQTGDDEFGMNMEALLSRIGHELCSRGGVTQHTWVVDWDARQYALLGDRVRKPSFD